jgi:uncharacterized iron-regulated membrane protein
MIEPWLIGGNKPSTEHRIPLERGDTGTTFEGEALPQGDFRKPGLTNNLMMVIKGLHAGRIAGTDLSIFLDIAAISLIFLTTTGIILSIRKLKR